MKKNLGQIALSLISKTVIMTTTIGTVIISSGKGTVPAQASPFELGSPLDCIKQIIGGSPEDLIASNPLDPGDGLLPPSDLNPFDGNNNDKDLVDVPEPDLNFGLIILVVLGAGALLKQNIKTKKDL